MKKKCNGCDSDKLLSEFNKAKDKKDGYQTSCRECNKRKLKEHYDNNKEYYAEKKRNRTQMIREYINSVKTNAQCTHCPEDDIACLDFHHEGDKEFELGTAASNGVALDRVKKEIDKCIILCSNCHRKLRYYE